MTLAPPGVKKLAAWAGTRPRTPVREPEAATARCELCPLSIGEDHRHLLHLDERRIVCVCETCWSMRSGDPEFRPPGTRSMILEDFAMSDEVWAAFQVPVSAMASNGSSSTAIPAV